MRCSSVSDQYNHTRKDQQDRVIHPAKQLIFSILVLISLVLFGTFGYMVIERWQFIESLYMTVITIASVGFSEVHPLSETGRIFTITIIIFGVSVLGYTVGKLMQTMFEGQLQRIIGRKMVEKKIDALKNHYIICGYGRMGSLICREFAARPVPFVVIESDPAVLERLEAENYLSLRGNATEDETLLKAGIRRAKGLISVVTSDTENVYITLSARGLNPDLFILARSGEPGTEAKLKQAGANKVVSPYQIGGMRMAQAVLRPNVVDFIELATGRDHLDLQMEEVCVPPDSVYAGRTLLECGFRKDTGVIIVGIKKATGKMVFNPDSNSLVEADDTLIILGEAASITKLEKLVGSSSQARAAMAPQSVAVPRTSPVVPS
jgi:voltage-gated potassium channel